jgi:hypothetical protein
MRFSRMISLLMPAFSLAKAPPEVPLSTSTPSSRSPTDDFRHPDASVAGLSPVTLSAQMHLTSELLRTL